ncbi:MAG: hypothetical protein KBB55_02275 [Candidatus Buchananbacteria bacterium]|nr:hypothetical protein [Candidatus Buchananbacteria bacterium]
MGRFFFKTEKNNHHFPELQQTGRLRRFGGFLARAYSPLRLTAGLMVVTVIVGGAYFWQTNASATQGYKIRELEDRLSDLKKENEKMQFDVVSRQSMEQVIAAAGSLNLVSSAGVEVITVPGTAVALR